MHYTIDDEQAEHIEDLWFLLHHSDEDNRVVLGLTAYLDDSGSDDGSKLVSIGGPLMTRIQFKEFSRRWDKMLVKHRVDSPLHMRDFIRQGKYAGRFPEMKRTLFWDVDELLTEFKLDSLSVTLEHKDFNSELSEDVRRSLIGPYAFAFFVAVAAHQSLSDSKRFGQRRTAYLVDSGFGYSWQLEAAHALLVNLEKQRGGFRFTGSLAFGSDDLIPALQAADVIAWAARNKQLLGALPEGFEPLEDAIRDDDIDTRHLHLPISKDGIQMFSAPVNKWISRRGEVPSLDQIVIQSKRTRFQTE